MSETTTSRRRPVPGAVQNAPEVKVMGADEGYKLARQLMKVGKMAEAKSIFKKILRVEPEHAEALHYLAVLYFQQGKKDEALSMARRAVALEPENVLFHANLGVMFQQSGMFYEAEAAQRRVLDLQPGDANAYYHLGLVFQLQDRDNEAEQAYLKALEIKPDHCDAVNNLGGLYFKQKKLNKSIAAFQQAVKLQPDDADLLYNYGCALSDEGKLDLAESNLRASLKLKPDKPEIHFNLGIVLQQQCRDSEAEAAFEKAISLRPNYFEAHYFLAEVHRFAERDDKVLARLNKLLTLPDLPGKAKCHTLAALGKTYEKLGQYTDAFQYHRQANDVKWRDCNFDARPKFRRIEEVKRYFPEPVTLVDQQRALTPIFVVGMSRSGKTLAESLLAQHADVYGAGENKEWSHLIKQVCKEHKIIQDYPNCVKQLSDEQVREIGTRYCRSLADEAPGSRYVVNTLPGNYISVGLILKSMPWAKIIFCHRSPLDHCLKVYFKHYRNGNDYSYNLAALGAYYLSYHEMMDYWRTLYPQGIHVVRYESMIGNPAEEARLLYRFCGLTPPSGGIDVSHVSKDEIGCSLPYESYLEDLRAALKLSS